MTLQTPKQEHENVTWTSTQTPQKQLKETIPTWHCQHQNKKRKFDVDPTPSPTQNERISLKQKWTTQIHTTHDIGDAQNEKTKTRRGFHAIIKSTWMKNRSQRGNARTLKRESEMHNGMKHHNWKLHNGNTSLKNMKESSRIWICTMAHSTQTTTNVKTHWTIERLC